MAVSVKTKTKNKERKIMLGETSETGDKDLDCASKKEAKTA